MDRYWSILGNILVVRNSIGDIVGYSSPDDLINTLITCGGENNESLITSHIEYMTTAAKLIKDDSLIYSDPNKNLFKQVYKEANTIHSRVLFLERAHCILSAYLIYLVANRLDTESPCIMCDFGTLLKGGLINETVGNCSKGAFYGIKVDKNCFKDIVIERLLTAEDEHEYEIENAKLLKDSSCISTLPNGQIQKLDLKEQMKKVLIITGTIRLADKVINGEKIA